MPALRLTIMTVASCIVMAAAQQAGGEQVLRAPAMPEWQLLHKVDPKYPSAAIQYRIQGTVRFGAVIGKDGHIERLRLIGGHPLLIWAAREAAQQWIYSPTLLDGKPARVITVIEVQFRLDPYGKPVQPTGVHRIGQAGSRLPVHLRLGGKRNFV